MHKIPFDFILDYLHPKKVLVKPFFGCYGLYVDNKMVFLLRNRKVKPEKNGIWVATPPEYSESVSKALPSIHRDLKLIEKKSKNTWLLISVEDDNFEPTIIKACEMIVKGDKRIGKITKSSLLVVVFLFSCMISFSQGFRTTDTAFYSANKIQSITYSNNKVRDSTVYYSQKTSEKTATFIYKGNGSEGTWIFYDTEGYKTSTCFVSNNKKTGPAVYYYKSGKVSSEELYENNLREGKTTIYFESGGIRWQGNYSKNKLDGESLHYYKNGKLQWAGMYKDGRMSGVRLCYTEFGTLCDGLFVIRDENNLLEREGMCRGGKPEGEVKQYANGKLVKTVIYKDGKPDGLTHRYKDQKIISTEVYKNGKFKKDVMGEPEGN